MSHEDSLIKKFLKDQYCLIAEPSPAFSSSIRSCLTSLGMSSDNIVVARKFEDARKFIDEKKPKLLITEYEIEQYFGLSLVEMQEKLFPEASRIAIIITKNSSDSVVAEAAEEQVDGFLLKPFSSEDFRLKISGILERKSNPTPYMSAIKQGKQHIAAKDFRAALEEFRKAKSLNPKPALACYYAGDCLQRLGETGAALKEFREGRTHQAINYKCLIGEFELLMGQKNYKEAYALVEILKNNFPLTPRRLAQIFMCAIFTYSFNDVGHYYDLFARLEQRSPELVKVASMALFTAGRFFLERKDTRSAMDLFEKGVSVSGRDFAFLEKVVDEFIKVNAAEEARQFLLKAPQSTIGTPEHSRLLFRVDQMTLSREQLVERGRKLVMAGEGSPEVYQIVVRLMAEEGKTTLAEAVISHAVAEVPSLRPVLYKILEESRKVS